MHMAGKRYADYTQEIMNEHARLVELNDWEEYQKFVTLIRDVATQTGIPDWKMQADYYELSLMKMKNQHAPVKRSDEEILGLMLELLAKAQKANIPHIEHRIRFDIIQDYFHKLKNYELAIEHCNMQDRRLQTVSSDDYPEKAHCYLQIAEIYYQFKDYPKAIYHIEKILNEQETLHNQIRRIGALNLLGLCYRYHINDLNRSDSCFQAIIQTNYIRPQDEQLRYIFEGMGEGNIGRNMYMRGAYDEAIPLFKSSMEKMLQDNDYGYAAGVAIYLASIYLKKDSTAEAKRYMDLAYDYYRKEPRESHLAFMYETTSKYYAATGNPTLSMAFMDSTLAARKQYEDQFNAMILLRMEQKESARKQQLLEHEKIRNRNYFLFAAAGCVLLSIALGLRIFYSRAIVRKNKGLYLQIKEYDRLVKELEAKTKKRYQPAKPADNHTGGTAQQRKLVSCLHDFLLLNSNFTNPDIEKSQLVSELTTNKTYLYEAVRAVTGKSLQDYINRFRLEEARRLLESQSGQTIETVADKCGFHSYLAFYRAFREHYKMNPADYRKMAKMNRQE